MNALKNIYRKSSFRLPKLVEGCLFDEISAAEYKQILKQHKKNPDNFIKYCNDKDVFRRTSPWILDSIKQEILKNQSTAKNKTHKDK